MAVVKRVRVRFLHVVKVLVGLGVGAGVLADAASYVELEAPGLWFLLSGV